MELPTIVIPAVAGRAGNILSELPVIIKRIIETEGIAIRLREIFESEISIDCAGNYKILSVDGRRIFPSVCMFGTREYGITYEMRDIPQFRAKPATFVLMESQSRKFAIRALCDTDSEIVEIVRVTVGTISILAGRSCSIPIVNLSVESDSIQMFGGKGGYLEGSIVVRIGEMDQSGEKVVNSYSIPLKIMVYAEPTIVTNVILPWRKETRTEKIDLAAVGGNGQMIVGNQLLAGKNINLNVESFALTLITANPETPIDVVWKIGRTINVARLVPWIHRKTIDFRIVAGETLTILLSESLGIPRSAVPNFSTIVTVAKRGDIELGQMTISPEKLTISSSSHCDDWFAMGFYACFAEGVNVKIYVKTLESVIFPDINCAIEVSGRGNYRLPSSCVPIMIDGCDVCEIGEDHVVRIFPETVTPGIYSLILRYQYAHRPQAININMRICPVLPREEVPIPVGETFFFSGETYMSMVDDDLFFSTCDMLEVKNLSILAQNGSSGLENIILKDGGISSTVPRTIYIVTVGRKIVLNFANVERAAMSQRAMSQRAISQRQFPGNFSRAMPLDVRSISSTYSIVVGIPYTTSILSAIGEGPIISGAPVAIVKTTVGGNVAYVANSSTTGVIYQWSSTYGTINFVPLLAEKVGYLSGSDLQVTVQVSAPGRTAATTAEPVVGLAGPADYLSSMLASTSIVSGKLTMILDELYVPNARYVSLVGAASATVSIISTAYPTGTATAISGGVYVGAFSAFIVPPPLPIMLGYVDSGLRLSANLCLSGDANEVLLPISGAVVSIGTTSALSKNGSVVSLVASDNLTPGSVSYTVGLNGASVGGGVWTGLSTVLTNTVSWNGVGTASVIVSSTSPTYTLSALANLPANAITLLHNNSALVPFEQNGGTIMMPVANGTYQLWYGIPSQNSAACSSIHVKTITNAVGITCVVGVVTTVNVPGIRTQTIVTDPSLLVTCTGSMITIAANQAGIFTALLQGAILLTITVVSSPVSWKCTAIAETNFPYLVILPIPGAVSGADILGNPLFFDVTGVKCLVNTDASSGTLTIVGNDQTIVVNVTFVRRTSILASFSVRTGSIDIPKSVGTYADSNVTYLSVDDVDVFSSTRGGQILPYVGISTNVVGNNLGNSGIQVANGSAVAGIYQTFARRTANFDASSEEFSQVFSMSENSLYFSSYFDGSHRIQACCKSNTFASFMTYNGTFAIAAFVGKIRVPLGRTISFTYSTRQSSTAITTGPPSYPSTDNFAVEVVDRQLPTIVLAGNFNPAFGTMFSSTIDASRNSSYDFANKSYIIDGTSGIDHVELVFSTVPKTIDLGSFMVIRGARMLGPVERSYAVGSVSNSSFAGTTVGSLTVNNSLVSLWIISPTIMNVPIVENGITSIDGCTVAIGSIRSIIVAVEGEICPTLLWCTANSFGTFVPVA